MQVRSQCRESTFKTHLVVTFTGTTVRQCIRTHFTSDFDLRFSNHRTRHGSTKQVFTFIVSAGFQRWVDVLFNEFFFQVNDVTFRGTR
ncbi:Uncharacterised protein [Vibrio cholerae]|uniref:Uncharacterized protein n=1 Tax=Vibrio cholerae TaxID=666 RepID=A0A655VWE0_VIBCL|nr:Uncharacterised protein [Vibrio cholerae]